jgi:hypothetical protein
VQAAGIVEALDVVEQIASGLGASGVDTGIFQRDTAYGKSRRPMAGPRLCARLGLAET